MAWLGRNKKAMVIGQPRSRHQRRGVRRRVRQLLLGVVLCGLAGLGLRHDQSEAQQRIVRMDFEQLRRATRLFRLDYGRCPHDVAELTRPPAGASPYLAQVPQDPWGNPFFLQCPGRWDETDVDVASRGPDGQWLGGDDISTDL